MPRRKLPSSRALAFIAAAAWVTAGFMGCSAKGGGVRAAAGTSSGDGFTSTSSGAAGGGGGAGGMSSSTFGTGGFIVTPDSGPTCPSTCASLGADCGAVTDTLCGGVVQCGNCPSGEICGGGGKHNVCAVGDNPDACSPKTCADQNITCGAAGDGCNGTLQCGTCNSPQTCGGDPTKPGQCGCTGTCALIPTCPTSQTTTLTGTVYDPAALHPLYNALVYIPNDPTDPGLQPFPPGITCDQCGSTAAGDPLVTTQTAPDGTFTLTNVPVGATIPLVVQLGKWRRQFTVNVANSCAANAIPDKTLSMPSTHLEGDLPRIAILTGGYDPVECPLRKMGVADSEFTDPGGGGYINFFLADEDPAYTPYGCGHGASIDANTPAQSSLFAVNGGVPVINQYDMVILECECYPQAESASDQQALLAYANAGGRVFASDFAYSWLYQNGNFAQAATWDVDQNGGGGTAAPVTIDLTSNPKGPAFDKWLEVVGVSTPGSDQIASITPVYHNTDGVVAPTQQWLHWESTVPIHFTFNTPVGAASASQCGRVVFSDWHSEDGNLSRGKTFPTECPAGAMTAQEAIVEFMLFDLSACVTPYTPLCTPTTCAALKVECGPAGDGCGGLLSCGTCTAPDTCGGGGTAGMCGEGSTCVPLNCAEQKIQCGPAGNGCGAQIDCGNCPTGQVCGLNGPGICGATQ